MIIYVLFVGMVETCCFVMDVQGHFIKVRFKYQKIWWTNYLVFIVCRIIPLFIFYPLPLWQEVLYHLHWSQNIWCRSFYTTIFPRVLKVPLQFFSDFVYKMFKWKCIHPWILVGYDHSVLQKIKLLEEGAREKCLFIYLLKYCFYLLC